MRQYLELLLFLLALILIEKLRINEGTRNVVQFFALMPMAVPGLVLGLAYIFFFNAKDNPLNFIYATMIILVVNTIVHFYTVSHLTAHNST